jgi:hypothetical protein
MFGFMVPGNIWAISPAEDVGSAGGDDDAEGAQILPRDLYWSLVMFQSMFGPIIVFGSIKNVENPPRRVSGCALDDPSTKVKSKDAPGGGPLQSKHGMNWERVS